MQTFAYTLDDTAPGPLGMLILYTIIYNMIMYDLYCVCCHTVVTSHHPSLYDRRHMKFNDTGHLSTGTGVTVDLGTSILCTIENLKYM